MKKYIVYITVMVAVIAAFVVVLNFFPRSEYSELERRELTKRPEFSLEALKSGDYTKGISSWYSDTEPFRDEFMTLSMQVRAMRALQIGAEEEQVNYIAAEPDPELASSPSSVSPVGSNSEESVPPTLVGQGGEQSEAFEELVPEQDELTQDERAKITNNGIFIVGKAPNARAMMAYKGKAGGTSYARVVNTYQEKFTDVNIYCMVIPTAVEYYCPAKARSATLPESATIDTLYAHLLPSVRKVYLLPVMAAHKDEPIYLRTDHHWSPLGAFYAAQEFCRVARVHVPELSEFDEQVTHRFVGSMYGFSRDISIKQSPEDFIYYTPKDVTYTATYTVYDIDSAFQVIGEHRPRQGEFFHHFKDGSGLAYCTFMGGDTKIAKVETSTRNGRRVLILKDSFGNALPGYLFGSFEEVHVVDGRYFTKNMVDYVSQNGITDIVFANNVFKAYGGGRQYLRFLTQRGSGIYTPRPQPKDTTAQAEPDTTVAAPTDTLAVETKNGTVFAADSLNSETNHNEQTEKTE